MSLLPRVAFGLGLVGALAVFPGRSDATTRAADFSLRDLTNTTQTLSQYKGKVVEISRMADDAGHAVLSAQKQTEHRVALRRLGSAGHDHASPAKAAARARRSGVPASIQVPACSKTATRGASAMIKSGMSRRRGSGRTSAIAARLST